MQSLYRVMAKLVSADLAVLIVGESGVGKGIVARTLHELGPRRNGPFIVCNLAAMPRQRIEEELFGDGARCSGRLAEATGGTLFLDEVGDLPLDAQAILLRAIDGAEASAQPSMDRRANVRIVVSTSRDLHSLTQAGKFREDLFFRLNVVRLDLPPLRDRVGDIPDLARAFLARSCREAAMPKVLAPAALDRLKVHTWPGNVRELENLMRRVSTLYSEDLITHAIVERELRQQCHAPNQISIPDSLSTLVEKHLVSHFAGQSDGLPPTGLFDRTLTEVMEPLLRLTLNAVKGNQVRASEILGLNRNTLRKKMSELGIHGARRRGRKSRASAEDFGVEAPWR